MKILLVAVLVVAACAGAPAAPAGDGRAEAASDPGRLYRARCSGCHRPYEPGSRTRAQWDAVLPRMARKAHLSGAEEEALHGWVTVGAADAKEGGADR